MLDHLVDAVPYQELLVVKPIDDGGHQPYIVAGLADPNIQDNLDDPDGYREELGPLVHEVVLQGRDVEIDLVQYRRVVFVYLNTL